MKWLLLEGSSFHLSTCLFATWDSFKLIFAILFHAGFFDFSLICRKESIIERIGSLGFSRYFFRFFLSASSRLRPIEKRFAMTGSQANRVDFKDPEIIRIVQFS